MRAAAATAVASAAEPADAVVCVGLEDVYLYCVNKLVFVVFIVKFARFSAHALSSVVTDRFIAVRGKNG